MGDQAKIFYTWDDVMSMCVQLTKKLSPGFKPKAIVGITRGGLIPAVMISHLIGVKDVFTLYASSYGVDNKRGDLTVFVDGKAQEALRSPDTLVIDDIIDSGATYELVKFQWPAKYYALVSKQLHLMHLAARHLPQAAWAVFPWESSHEGV